MKWWQILVVLVAVSAVHVRSDEEEDDDGVSVEVEEEVTEKVKELDIKSHIQSTFEIVAKKE